MEAVVIPTYKEGENIGKLVQSVFSNLPGSVVIVVDDNSPDDTAKIIKSLQKKNKNLHLIIRKGKGGRGSAVIEGLSYALKMPKAEMFLEMDADFSHDPAELPRLLKLSKPDTVVIGSRYVKGSKIINWPLLRRISSKMSNMMIKILLGMPISDNTNGLRCYSRKAAQVLVKHNFTSKGYIVLTESAYVLYRNSFKFIEVKSMFVNRKIGESKTSIMEFVDSFINVIKILFSV